MGSKQLLLFDRSRSTCDWQCKRRRFLNYELGGTGVVPASQQYELEMGSIIHESLAEIARQTLVSQSADIDTIAHKAHEDMHLVALAQADDSAHISEDEVLYASEQSTLVEGMLRGFYKHCWPRLLNRYPKILAVEQEMSYDYQSITFMAKPDLVLADKEGEVVYVEYKSTSTKKEEWITSWNTAIQVHATSRAIQANLGVEVGHVIVQGLYKGYESYGKQNSPFCYAYLRKGSPPFSKDQLEYEYKSGFKKSPVWEMEGGCKAWVEAMPEMVLANQFPCTPPIFIDDMMVERFFAQRLMREHEIQLAMQMLEKMEDPSLQTAILDTSFEQDFSQCSPAWGRGCPYKIICHGQVPDPLKAGSQPRKAHHAIEEAAMAAEESV